MGAAGQRGKWDILAGVMLRHVVLVMAALAIRAASWLRSAARIRLSACGYGPDVELFGMVAPGK